MAAYPFTTFSRDSAASSDDGRTIVRATNGVAKVRVLYPADKKKFTLAHRLTSVQLGTLNTFYGSNRDITWTLAFDGGTSTCVFAQPPQTRPQPGGAYFVTVLAEEV